MREAFVYNPRSDDAADGRCSATDAMVAFIEGRKCTKETALDLVGMVGDALEFHSKRGPLDREAFNSYAYGLFEEVLSFQAVARAAKSSG